MRKLPLIESGWQVFLVGSSAAFGAVRAVFYEGLPQLLVNVEGGGDFRVPLDAVAEVSPSKKVIVRWDHLPDDMRHAIRHTLDVEDFPPPGDEVELVPPPSEDDIGP